MTTRVGLLAVTLAVVAVARPSEPCVMACPEKQTTLDHRNRAETVFTATVLSVDDGVATLQVGRTFKGTPGTKVKARSGYAESCEVPFHLATEWLVFATERDGLLIPVDCAPVLPLSGAPGDPFVRDARKHL